MKTARYGMSVGGRGRRIAAAAILGGLALAAAGVTAAAPTASASAVAAGPAIRIERGTHGGALASLLQAAWRAYRDGNLDLAAQRYGEVLHENVANHEPSNRDALLGMAAIARRRAQDRVAAQYYRRVLALDPRDPDAQAGMASLPAAGNAEDTESTLKLLLAQRPRSAVLHFALGNHYAQQARWAEAQQAYFNAFSLAADDARFAFNLAVSLDHLGQGELAARYYERALQLAGAGDPGFNREQARARLDELRHS